MAILDPIQRGILFLLNVFFSLSQLNETFGHFSLFRIIRDKRSRQPYKAQDFSIYPISRHCIPNKSIVIDLH